MRRVFVLVLGVVCLGMIGCMDGYEDYPLQVGKYEYISRTKAQEMKLWIGESKIIPEDYREHHRSYMRGPSISYLGLPNNDKILLGVQKPIPKRDILGLVFRYGGSRNYYYSADSDIIVVTKMGHFIYRVKEVTSQYIVLVYVGNPNFDFYVEQYLDSIKPKPVIPEPVEEPLPPVELGESWMEGEQE